MDEKKEIYYLGHCIGYCLRHEWLSDKVVRLREGVIDLGYVKAPLDGKKFTVLLPDRHDDLEIVDLNYRQRGRQWLVLKHVDFAYPTEADHV